MKSNICRLFLFDSSIVDRFWLPKSIRGCSPVHRWGHGQMYMRPSFSFSALSRLHLSQSTFHHSPGCGISDLQNPVNCDHYEREDIWIFGESSPTTASISSDMAAYIDFLNDDYPDDASPSFHAMSTADGVTTVNTSSSATAYVIFPLR